MGLRTVEKPVAVVTGIRSWCRLMAGLLVLSHRNGRRSMARSQTCVFCTWGISNPIVHVFSCCWCFREHREDFLARSGRLADSAGELARKILGAAVRSAGLNEAVFFCSRRRRRSEAFLAPRAAL